MGLVFSCVFVSLLPSRVATSAFSTYFNGTRAQVRCCLISVCVCVSLFSPHAATLRDGQEEVEWGHPEDQSSSWRADGESQRHETPTAITNGRRQGPMDSLPGPLVADFATDFPAYGLLETDARSRQKPAEISPCQRLALLMAALLHSFSRPHLFGPRTQLWRRGGNLQARMMISSETEELVKQHLHQCPWSVSNQYLFRAIRDKTATSVGQNTKVPTCLRIWARLHLHQCLAGPPSDTPHHPLAIGRQHLHRPRPRSRCQHHQSLSRIRDYTPAQFLDLPQPQTAAAMIFSTAMTSTTYQHLLRPRLPTILLTMSRTIYPPLLP